ncbi:MAG: glycosyltransferase family 4 protein [Anaerolineales bacterium]|nr:glycosyltransferase family 4 protein [Anaerolineales bacterium]
MQLLFIADGRSATARNWINAFLTPENHVHLISTAPCKAVIGLASLQVLPVAFSGFGTADPIANSTNVGPFNKLRQLAPLPVRTFIRQWLGPLTLAPTARQMSKMIEEIKPDMVHAMRYPFEGILAAQAKPSAPLVVSVWGNDFTLHARSNPFIGHATRHALRRTSALHADCQRDLHLARALGFPVEKPAVVLPGSGGVRSSIFFPPADPRPAHPPVIINPRGFRAYIRNHAFFKSIPLVLQKYPQAKFICPAMDHEPQAHTWVEKYAIQHSVELLPLVPQGRIADLFRQAHIVVSPSTHDGTPNTLLEAMACGCFPVAGNIESVREWLVDRENSLLVDPGDPAALAEAIIGAIKDTELREKAVAANLKMVAQRADFQKNMAEARKFYLQVLEQCRTN